MAQSKEERREKNRLYQKQYYRDNIEKVKKRHKEYAISHESFIKEVKRKYDTIHKKERSDAAKIRHAENREYDLNVQRRYYRKNKEYVLSKTKAYQKENKVHITKMKKQFSVDNPELMRQRSKKAGLMRKYGITIEQYDEMYCKQEGCCAICGAHQSDLKYTLHVDHDHVTNEIRGLLCKKCNTGIGQFSDSPDILKLALNYLSKNK